MTMQPDRHGSRFRLPSLEALSESDRQWWQKNQLIIQWLDDGQTVKQISTISGIGTRQVREIRSRLGDIRDVES